MSDQITREIAHIEEQIKNTRRQMYTAGKSRNASGMGRLLKIEAELIARRNKLMAQ
jgi:hypothetical protein